MKNFSKLMVVVCLSTAASFAAVPEMKRATVADGVVINNIEVANAEIGKYRVLATETSHNGLRRTPIVYYTNELSKEWEVKKETLFQGIRRTFIPGTAVEAAAVTTAIAGSFGLGYLSWKFGQGRKEAVKVSGASDTSKFLNNTASKFSDDVQGSVSNWRGVTVLGALASPLYKIWVNKGFTKEYVVKKA